MVERGTAKAAQIDGYTIAGKTGTAAKLVNGRYSNSDYNASFVGFVPSRKPALAIIVVIDSPHGAHGYYGGTVAAPIFKRIAEASLRHLGSRRPSTRPAGAGRGTPSDADPPRHRRRLSSASAGPGRSDARSARHERARSAARLRRVGLTPRMTGRRVRVEQSPEAGRRRHAGDGVLKLNADAVARAGGRPQ